MSEVELKLELLRRTQDRSASNVDMAHQEPARGVFKPRTVGWHETRDMESQENTTSDVQQQEQTSKDIPLHVVELENGSGGVPNFELFLRDLDAPADAVAAFCRQKTRVRACTPRQARLGHAAPRHTMPRHATFRHDRP